MYYSEFFYEFSKKMPVNDNLSIIIHRRLPIDVINTNLSAIDNLNYFASFYPAKQRRDVGKLLIYFHTMAETYIRKDAAAIQITNSFRINCHQAR